MHPFRVTPLLLAIASVFLCGNLFAADGPSTNAEANRLVHEKSPYLRQYAYNPVDWFPWGDAAFDKAKAENKLVFLSVGYSTCHWCRVMNRESFSDPEIAAYLNENYVCIKVDRKERPDVDQVYMTFAQRAIGHGGWPLNVWLTPDRKPFYAAPTSRGPAAVRRRFRKSSNASTPFGRRSPTSSSLKARESSTIAKPWLSNSKN